MTGQEERDVLFAQLFGIMSIVQSGLVVRTKPLATSASSSTAASSAQSFLQTVSQLLELGEKRSWLRESAWFAISLATEALHHSDAEWKEDALEKLLGLLFQTNANWSTEKIAVALKLQDYYPQRDWKTLLSSTFKNPDLLCSVNLATISRILKVSNNRFKYGCFNIRDGTRSLPAKTDRRILCKHQVEHGNLSSILPGISFSTKCCLDPIPNCRPKVLSRTSSELW